MPGRNYTLFADFVLDVSEPIREARRVGDAFEESGTRAKKSFQGFGAQLKGLARIVFAATVIGWAFELQYVMRQLTSDVIKFGAALDNVRTGTAQLSQASGIGLSNVAAQVREAADGTLTLAESFRQVNQALLLGGGPAIVERLPELFEIARFNARAMGIDVERALESMVTGLGRVSPRWLDNLGVIIDTRRVYQDWADDNDRLVSSLTEAEQRVALIAAIIEKYGGLVEAAGGQTRTAAEDLQALSAAFADLKALAGESFLGSGPFKAFLDWMVETIHTGNQFRVLTKDQQRAIQDLDWAMGRAANTAINSGILGGDLPLWGITDDKTINEIKELEKRILDLAIAGASVTQLESATNDLFTRLEELTGHRPTLDWSEYFQRIAKSVEYVDPAIKNFSDNMLAEQKKQRDAYDRTSQSVKKWIDSIEQQGAAAVKNKASMESVTRIVEDYRTLFDQLLASDEFLALDPFQQLLQATGILSALNRELEQLTEVSELGEWDKRLQQMGQKAIQANVPLSTMEHILADASKRLKELQEDPIFINLSELGQFEEANKIFAETQEKLDTLEGFYKITLEVDDGDVQDFLDDFDKDILRLVERGLPIADAQGLGKQAEDFAWYLNSAHFNPETRDLLIALVSGRLSRAGEELIPPSAEELARDAAAAAREAQRAYEEWRRALESDVEMAVLNDLEVTKDDFLPGRKDAPLEAVRRLRDIVNLGLESPWADYFEIPEDVLAQGEDAVKRWAFDLSERGAELRDINLIDKDAFLRELEEIKTARQERAAVMEQLIQWAIDAGLAGNKKEAKKLAKDYLGLPTADGLTQGMEDEVKDYKFADFVTGAFDDDMDKNFGKYKNSGRDMANAMFSGWEEQMNENISGYQYSPPEGEPPDPSGASPSDRISLT